MIFVDSWAFLALANRRDSDHQKAVCNYETIKERGCSMVTSDYILDEVITSLFRKVNFESAQRFIEAIFQDIREENLLLERIDEGRFNYAWLLRSIYRDKPDISFTDLTSFVLMKEADISRVFTKDRHFEMANLGFEIWPDPE
ncbi:MAG: PIN domain-containing protein [Methanothrix sp.]|nr:PIN domain-containing protein [Methanothrix sp.]